jgi:hypothetical protein
MPFYLIYLNSFIKKLHPETQKEKRKTTEETSGCVRPERVNKCDQTPW